MQTATSETESKSLDLSICVHHYTLRAPCPKGQGTVSNRTRYLFPTSGWAPRARPHVSLPAPPDVRPAGNLPVTNHTAR